YPHLPRRGDRCVTHRAVRQGRDRRGARHPSARCRRGRGARDPPPAARTVPGLSRGAGARGETGAVSRRGRPLLSLPSHGYNAPGSTDGRPSQDGNMTIEKLSVGGSMDWEEWVFRYPSGAVKARGPHYHGDRQEHWTFYYESGE